MKQDDAQQVAKAQAKIDATKFSEPKVEDMHNEGAKEQETTTEEAIEEEIKTSLAQPLWGNYIPWQVRQEVDLEEEEASKNLSMPSIERQCPIHPPWEAIWASPSLVWCIDLARDAMERLCSHVLRQEGGL